MRLDQVLNEYSFLETLKCKKKRKLHIAKYKLLKPLLTIFCLRELYFVHKQHINGQFDIKGNSITTHILYYRFKFHIISQSNNLSMFHFDNSFQQQCMTDCYNNFNNNFASSYYYGPTNYVWNYDYSNFQPTSYFPNNSLCSQVKDYDPFGKEDIKGAVQTTRGTLSDEDIAPQQEEMVKDEQIEPEIKETQDDNSHKGKQKFGRNIASNIFHNIIKKSSTQKEFSDLAKSIILINKLSITYNEFMEKLTDKSKKIKGYVNLKTIRSILTGKSSKSNQVDSQFSKILRILSKIYINKYHLPHIFHSSKIKRKSRGLHVKRMRKLLKLIM